MTIRYYVILYMNETRKPNDVVTVNSVFQGGGCCYSLFYIFFLAFVFFFFVFVFFFFFTFYHMMIDEWI